MYDVINLYILTDVFEMLLLNLSKLLLLGDIELDITGALFKKGRVCKGGVKWMREIRC